MTSAPLNFNEFIGEYMYYTKIKKKRLLIREFLCLFHVKVYNREPDNESPSPVYILHVINLER